MTSYLNGGVDMMYCSRPSESRRDRRS